MSWDIILGAVQWSTLLNFIKEMPTVALFVVLVVVVAVSSIASFLVGVMFAWIFVQKRMFPTTWRDYGLEQIRSWTQQHVREVRSYMQKEQKDLKHLARNLDHMTRPTTIVHLFDQKYVVVEGSRDGSHLVHLDDHRALSMTREEHIMDIVRTIGGDVARHDWTTLIHDMKMHPFTHDEHLARVRTELHAAGIAEPAAVEYYSPSRPPSQRPSRIRKSTGSTKKLKF